MKKNMPLNNKAFTELYKKYKGRYFFAVLDHARSREDAEDILQNVMIKVFNNDYINNPNVENIDYLIKRVISNTAIDFYRKSIYNNRTTEITENKNELEAKKPVLPAEIFLKKKDKRSVEEKLTILPKQQYEIITLRVIDKQSYTYIAESLGLDRKTVKRKYDKAISILKDNYYKCISSLTISTDILTFYL